MLSETPGRLLSTARESRSLSQADIAKQTRLSLQAINDIEQDVYDRFGAATFVRGYLRSYARAVGVSEEKILAAWEASDAMAKLKAPAPAVVAGISFTDENRRDQSVSNAPSRTVMVVGALVVLSAIVWWEDQQNTNTAPVVVNAAAVVPKAPVVLPVAAPAQVAAKAETPAIQPETTTHEKVIVKKIKRAHAVRHHHAEPMHVTYTLKPVSPSELAPDH